MNAEKRFGKEPVHPAGRARVPGPTSATDVRRDRVDVGRDDVRLHFVDRDLGGGRAVMNRIEQPEKFPRAIGFSLERESHRRPDRAMGVLAAILAHARDVAFDVTRIERRLVEGRSEELDQFCVSPNEARVDCFSAWRERSGSPAPLMTDQLCGSESI